MYQNPYYLGHVNPNTRHFAEPDCCPGQCFHCEECGYYWGDDEEIHEC
jgi:hypothetical protein